MTILCLDGGSSSLKFAVYEMNGGSEKRLLRGAAEELGQTPARFWVEGADGNRNVDDSWADQPDTAAALDRIFQVIGTSGYGPPDAVGHRIVFGGPDHAEPAIVEPNLLAVLESYVPFDPLHLRSQLDLVRAVAARLQAASQVLCFDSAFHHSMPAIARRIPLPRSMGPLMRRYGYHGLSFEYIVSVLGGGADGRVLIAHLGNGASLAAVRAGRPVDTTMGFSPLGGLMMGTRPGDMDPGVFLYLATIGMAVADLEELFNKRSGLLGVSESSSNMEVLLNRAGSDERAREAIDFFVYQIIKHAGAMIAVLGGLHTLVFTGGIGERAAEIRQLVSSGLAHFGIDLDRDANSRGADTVSRANSRVTVRVIPTDEAVIIARHVRTVLEHG